MNLITITLVICLVAITIVSVRNVDTVQTATAVNELKQSYSIVKSGSRDVVEESFKKVLETEIRRYVSTGEQYDFHDISIASIKTTQKACTAATPITDIKTGGSQPGFPPSNVVDNNSDTLWSNYGLGSWIVLDLGTIKRICTLDIAWYKGNERQNSFVISTSLDGLTFTDKLSSKSTGTTLDPEKYNIPPTDTRYVKVTVNGNNKNDYASISEVYVFNSNPISNYSIAAAGDWGSGRNDNWKKTVRLMIDNKVDLALGLGDYSYGSKKEFEPIVDALNKSGIPMKGAKGDHDSTSYEQLFKQPSMRYAFNAGSARIIILNTEESPSSNAAFLEKNLRETKQAWNIVITPTPLYTSPSKHGEDKDQIRVLQPLFDKYNVDLVMWADNHNYERIKLPNKATVFIQSGTGGESHYKFDGQRQGSLYQNDKDFGITKIIISGDSLAGQFISHKGKVLDYFNVRK